MNQHLQSTPDRPFSDVLGRLREAGLRPTRQRLALARLLLGKGGCHVTADSLHAMAIQAGIKLSLATVYNNLHQFTEAGLLREVVVEPGITYFDSNMSEHHHMYLEPEGRLVDITDDQVALTQLPELPSGSRVKRVDVVIRVDTTGS
jgi:Fur family transcriptional regulator, iron response regulator